MSRIKQWLKGIGESPAFIIRLGLLAVAIMGLGYLGVFPGVMQILLGLTCLSVCVVGGLTLFVAAARGETPDEELIDFSVPGTPGRRRWKHNVYDENAYAILGVPQNATHSEIRDSFRRLAQRYHPDSAALEEKERASLVFHRLDQAYELLSDPENRVRYDAWIERLGGKEPMLDTACEVFRNAENRAHFDRDFGLRFPANSAEQKEHVAVPELLTMPAALASPPAGPDELAVGDESGSPVEVEVPEAIREALGMSSPGKSACAVCGTPLLPGNAGQTHCRKCASQV